MRNEKRNVSDPFGTVESMGLATTFGHGAPQMTDSAALYSLYAKLSPSLTLAQITTLLKSASPVAGRSLEYALDALRTVLQGKTIVDAAPTTFDSPDAESRRWRDGGRRHPAHENFSAGRVAS